MTTYLTILTMAAGQPAAKSFVRNEHGAITKLPMRMSKYFTVERRAIKTIHDLAAALTDLNSSPRKFVIRGEPAPGVDLDQPIRRLKYDGDESRATFRSSPNGQSWVCFDFDKINYPDGIFPARDFENAMIYLSDLLPPEFHDVTFWAQLSSSAGINGWNTLSAHLWFMLDRSITDDDLHLWAETIEAPIDTRLFNAVQPHFTAAPIFAYNVFDPCPVRHMLIKGARDVVSFQLCAGQRLAPIAPRSSNPQMGGGRQNPRPGATGTAINVERPLLSEWLTRCFPRQPSSGCR